ncbi:hypothetical protein AYI69_g5848 [Smittium culicis]|uniref:Uncharacterized protein n=1 Tax=Smittium culicis TaxID=133412 RepID=A0A1R1Y3D8_9FUNG|nr:hypothetical protein AYI69_g5848 [Smittium culicis]
MMEQQAETQATMSQDQLKILADMVQQLKHETERSAETEDPYVTTMIPVTDLTVYPELTEALPSIEEDLFRTPLAEEERKIAIHSSPKTSSMNYIPPPLNDSASSAVKKADSVLYGPPRKTYATSRVRYQATDGSRGVGHPHLQEICGETITRLAISQAQQNTILKDTYSSNTATAQSTKAATTAEAYSINRIADHQIPFKNPHSPAPISKGALRAPFETEGTWRGPEGPAPSVSPSNSTADVPFRIESYRRDSAEGSRLLQPAFHDPKEDWRPQISLGPPQTQPARGGAKLLNGETGENLPHHSQKGLSLVLRSSRCVHAYTIPRPTIRTISEPVGIYQDSSPSSRMDQNKTESRLSLPRRHFDNGENEGGVCSNHTLDILQALGAWIQGSVNQDQGSSTRGKKATERWEDDVEISRELYWESPVNVDCTAAVSPYASPTFITKESITVDTEITDIDKQTDVMERALILSRDARIGIFHEFQQHSLGNSGGIPHLLRIMESKRGKDEHKRQGAAHSIVRTQTQDFYRPQVTYVPSVLNPADAPSRLTVTKRIFVNTGSIQNSKFSLWPARRRPFSIPPGQEGGILLMLVPRHRFSKPECTSLQLVRVQQPIQLPAMESDLPSSSESPTRMRNNNSGDTNKEAWHLVIGPIGSINLAACYSASNHDHTGSKKRKVAALGKQALALDG